MSELRCLGGRQTRLTGRAVDHAAALDKKTCLDELEDSRRDHDTVPTRLQICFLSLERRRSHSEAVPLRAIEVWHIAQGEKKSGGGLSMPSCPAAMKKGVPPRKLAIMSRFMLRRRRPTVAVRPWKLVAERDRAEASSQSLRYWRT